MEQTTEGYAYGDERDAQPPDGCQGGICSTCGFDYGIFTATLKREEDLRVEVERLHENSELLKTALDIREDQLRDSRVEVARLRDFAAGQPCDCYDEYGQRFAVPCERCRIVYRCESWEEFEKAAEAAGKQT